MDIEVTERETGRETEKVTEKMAEKAAGKSTEEFIRTELITGREGLLSLRRSTVAVFGIGGVGSHCAEALARSGVGRLILVDNDVVTVSNINRQCVAYHSTVGMAKTQVMKRIIQDICPDTEVLTFETFVLTDNLAGIFQEAGRVDYIVDAIDTVTAKLSLAEYAKAHDIPFIASMGTGNKLHPELFEITDIEKTSVCPLCKVMRRELKNRGVGQVKVLYSREIPVEPDAELEERLIREELGENSKRRSIPGSIAFVPPAAGLMIAGEVVRELAGL